MIPSYPLPEDELEDLQQMARSAKRALLVLEGKARELKADPAVESWRGFPEALAVCGFALSLALRKRGQRAPLSFFAARMPKSEFEIPEWLCKQEA